MKVAAAVLTWNQHKTGRHELFKETVRSLSGADYLFLVDNGSTDGSSDYVAGLGGYVNRGPITSCGYGMNLAAGITHHTDADIVVFSNDDIIWHDGAVDALRDLWLEMPADVKIVSGLLQPTYPWNKPYGKLDTAAGAVLFRETVPGGAWTYRRSDYTTVYPVPTKPGWDDVPTCRRLNGLGFRVGAIDLSTHQGEGLSSWGNVSFLYEQQSLDDLRAEWAL